MARQSAVSKLSAQDRITALLQRNTQREAAKLLNVSIRTIQRWKNEGVNPSPKNAPKLAREATKERSRIRAIARRSNAPELGLSVPVVAKRQTRLDPNNIKNRILADTVAFDVKRARLSDIVALVASYRGQNRSFMVIYRVPPGKEGESVLFYRRPNPKGFNEIKTWEYIDQRQFITNAGIEKFLLPIARYYKILYIVVTIPKPKQRRKASKK